MNSMQPQTIFMDYEKEAKAMNEIINIPEPEKDKTLIYDGYAGRFFWANADEVKQISKVLNLEFVEMANGYPCLTMGFVEAKD